MSLNDNSSNELGYNEYKVKEKLYTLFYELTSEIKGTKIEIDEDEYEENIRTTSAFQIIEYIYQTLQILLKKYKKENIKKINPKENEINQYELILRKYENDNRFLIKQQFQQKLIRESLEYKLEEYMEMEEEFEEMKSKLKYEDGKFLENDRKDNEIIIIRQENSNLKLIISNLEKDIIEKNNLIEELKEKYNNVQIKLEETEKELNLFSNIDINNLNNINNNSNLGNHSMINYVPKNLNNLSNLSTISYKNYNTNNISKNSFCLCKNNISEIKNIIDLKIFNLKSTKTSSRKNKHIHELFGNNKNIISDLSIKNNVSKKKINHNRNNSMNMLLDKKKINLISKYLSNKKSNRTTINTNNNNIIYNYNYNYNYNHPYNNNNNNNNNYNNNNSNNNNNNNSNNNNNNSNSNKKKINNYKNLTCRTKKQNNNTCLKIMKKIPFISQNGNLTNRSVTNKNFNRSTSFKKQKNCISKIIKAKNLVNSNNNIYNKSSTSISTSRIDY